MILCRIQNLLSNTYLYGLPLQKSIYYNLSYPCLHINLLTKSGWVGVVDEYDKVPPVYPIFFVFRYRITYFKLNTYVVQKPIMFHICWTLIRRINSVFDFLLTLHANNMLGISFWAFYLHLLNIKSWIVQVCAIENTSNMKVKKQINVKIENLCSELRVWNYSSILTDFRMWFINIIHNVSCITTYTKTYSI